MADVACPPPILVPLPGLWLGSRRSCDGGTASGTTPIVGVRDAAIQGIVEANLGWRDVESMGVYLVFGDGNMDLYACHLPTGEYHVLDRVPGNLIETHPSFELLMAAAFKSRL